MYLLNAQTIIKWKVQFPEGVSTITELAFIVTTPDDEVSYSAAGSLILPDGDTQASLTQLFTPITEGLWEVKLVKGPPETYKELGKATFYAFDNVTEVYPVGYNPDSLDLIGI